MGRSTRPPRAADAGDGRLRHRGPALVWEAQRHDPRFPSPRALALATASLPVGFAVAEVTGVRALGGAVLAGLAIAALLTSRSSPRRKAAYTLILLALFAASHVIAGPVGTWPAIALVTTLAGGAAFHLLQPADAPGS